MLRWKKSGPCFALFLCFVLLTTTLRVSSVVSAAQDDPSNATSDEASAAANEESAPKEATKQRKKLDFDVDNEDWGTYYDPQNVFCGKFDCYRILGFDYETYGTVKPSTKEITQRYRQLSRAWHPDKSKHKHAKERFVKISRAYEVLTDKEVRAEYDRMRYDQDAYFTKYGTSVFWSYAPQTDVTAVLLLLFIVGNVFSWYSQKHRWQLVADRLIKAAVEDWSPREGGSPESKQLREEALKILQEREAEASQVDDKNGDSTATPSMDASQSSSIKKKPVAKGSKKLPAKERKKQEQDALLPIITELVDAMDDFGGGFHKPSRHDLLVVTMAKLPIKIATGVTWQLGYLVRRLQKKDLNDEERLVLTSRAVGPVVWSTASDEDKEAWKNRELWVKENLLEWLEEQEIKNLSTAEQKHYNKLKKKGKLDKIE
jgi:DnaJ homolog subfamily C member 25